MEGSAVPTTEVADSLADLHEQACRALVRLETERPADLVGTAEHLEAFAIAAQAEANMHSAPTSPGAAAALFWVVPSTQGGGFASCHAAITRVHRIGSGATMGTLVRAMEAAVQYGAEGARTVLLEDGWDAQLVH